MIEGQGAEIGTIGCAEVFGIINRRHRVFCLKCIEGRDDEAMLRLKPNTAHRETPNIQYEKNSHSG